MEDNKLWQEYQKNKDYKIKEQIINKYANLVKIVAGRLNIYTSSQIEYEDLISYGIFGLIDAIDKFDIEKGYKFETYASLRIRGEIIDNIRKLDWVPRALRQKNKVIENAIKEYEMQYGKEPDAKELSNKLDMPLDEINKLIKNASLYNLISLDGYLEQSHEKVNDGLIIKETDMPEQILEKNEQKNEMKNCINSLTKKQQQVITLYYYEELTLKEISKIMGVSESRISQIHSNCMKILKNKLKNSYKMFY